MAPARTMARPPMETVLIIPAPVGVGVGRETVVEELVEFVAAATATRAAATKAVLNCILIVGFGLIRKESIYIIKGMKDVEAKDCFVLFA